MLSPAAVKRLHKWATIVWAVQFPVAIGTGLIFSLAYISSVSIYTVVVQHGIGWLTARVEVRQEADG